MTLCGSGKEIEIEIEIVKERERRKKIKEKNEMWRDDGLEDGEGEREEEGREILAEGRQ